LQLETDSDRLENLSTTPIKKAWRGLSYRKLDRLARDVAFVANLMESGVEFQAVDMPYANKLTVHILAAVAEHEREAISDRTKAALGAAKARGTKPGNPRWKASISKARAARSQNKSPHEVIETIKKKRDAGLTCCGCVSSDLHADLRTEDGCIAR
jgi:DNA invertase Pin-like site-specific DNA recombinase